MNAATRLPEPDVAVPPADSEHLLAEGARTEVLNRLRRAEGQLRGIQRMVERDEDCRKVAQQFAAVRSALDATYVRLTMCQLAQQLNQHLPADAPPPAELPRLLADLEALLLRRG